MATCAVGDQRDAERLCARFCASADFTHSPATCLVVTLRRFQTLIRAFSQAARFAQAALVDGGVGVVLAPSEGLSRALRFTIEDGRIIQVDVIGDPARLRELDLAVL